MKSAKFYSHWLEHDGKRVYIDGKAYLIRARLIHAIYPYEHDVVDVIAEPCNRRSKGYLDIKRKLGDDWVTDVLEMDIEKACDIETQCKNLSSL